MLLLWGWKVMVKNLLLADATKGFEWLEALEGRIEQEEPNRDRLKVVLGLERACCFPMSKSPPFTVRQMRLPSEKVNTTICIHGQPGFTSWLLERICRAFGTWDVIPDACRQLMMVVLSLLRRWVRCAMWQSCLLSCSVACILFFVPHRVCLIDHYHHHYITTTIFPPLQHLSHYSVYTAYLSLASYFPSLIRQTERDEVVSL